MKIKNIVFDIGNVLVKWDPEGILKHVFPHEDLPLLHKKIIQSETWRDLNLGKITEEQAILSYHKSLNIEKKKFVELFAYVKESFTPLEGSFELLEHFYKKNTAIYSITDNVHEFVSYLKNRYDFWDKFKGAAVSAELGVMKPSKEIYLYLLHTYKLIPEETLFLDDLMQNVEGARAVGMKALQFTNAEKCKEDLQREFDIYF